MAPRGARRAARARPPGPAPHRADGVARRRAGACSTGAPTPTALWERVGRAAGVVRGDDWEPALTRFADEARRQAAEDGRPPTEADAALGLLRFVGELRADLGDPAALRPWAEWRAWADGGARAVVRSRDASIDSTAPRAGRGRRRRACSIASSTSTASAAPVTRAEFRATFMAELDDHAGAPRQARRRRPRQHAGRRGRPRRRRRRRARRRRGPAAAGAGRRSADRRPRAGGRRVWRRRTSSPRSCTASSSPPPPPRRAPSSRCPVATSGRRRSARAPAGSIPLARPTAPSGSSTPTPRAWRRPPSRCRRPSTASASCGSARAPATTSATSPSPPPTPSCAGRWPCATPGRRTTSPSTTATSSASRRHRAAGAGVADPARGVDGLPARLLRAATCSGCGRSRRPADVEQLGAADRGTALHAALDRLHRAVIDGELPQPGPDRLEPERTSPTSSRPAPRSPTSSSSAAAPGWAAFWANDRAALHGVLDAWVADENAALAGVARSSQSERRFDVDDAVALTLPSGRSLSFKGSIDRVEELPDGAPRRHRPQVGQGPRPGEAVGRRPDARRHRASSSRSTRPRPGPRSAAPTPPSRPGTRSSGTDFRTVAIRFDDDVWARVGAALERRRRRHRGRRVPGPPRAPGVPAVGRRATSASPTSSARPCGGASGSASATPAELARWFADRTTDAEDGGDA